MTRRLLALCVSLVLVCSLLLTACRNTKDPDVPADTTTTASGSMQDAVEGETTDAEFTVETNAEGNTVVVDSDGNVVADSGQGDEISVGSDGSIQFVDEAGDLHIVVSPSTAPASAASTDGSSNAASSAGSTASSKVGSTTAKTGGNSGTATTAANTPAPAAAYSGILPGSAEAGVSFATLAKAPADNPVSVAASTKQFGRFLLTTTDNTGLPFNIACYIGADRITAVVPASADLSAVKANFTYYGKNVLYNGAELVSRTTVMNLTKDATLTLNAQDGSSRTVTVHIERLATGLPSLSLNTSGYAAVDSTATYRTASFAVGGGDSSVCAYATSSQTKGADCSIKGRGNTSWTYDKKCYTLRFDTRYPLLGLPESKNYVLLALYADQSLMRYRLGEFLSESMGMEFTMNLRYVDLWLNGEYMGVYGLVEKIEVEKNHVNITDYVNNSTAVNQMGYLLEFDDHLYNNASEAQRNAWKAVGKGYYDPAINETFFYLKTLGTDWITIRTTNAKNLTADHVNYIYAVVNNAMEALKSGDYSKITAYIDVESFVKWYLIEEYLNNTDSDMTSSVYMYIDVGGKLKLGPLWDLDNCAGNHTATASAAAHTLYDSQSGWFYYLFKCSEARAVLKTQWTAMQATLDKVNATLDGTAAMLKTAAALNFTRWPQLGTNLSSQPAAIASANTYQKQVDYLKNYLSQRRSALDTFFKGL